MPSLDYDVHELLGWRTQVESELTTLRGQVEELRGELRRASQRADTTNNQLLTMERSLSSKLDGHEQRLRRLGSIW